MNQLFPGSCLKNFKANNRTNTNQLLSGKVGKGKEEEEEDMAEAVVSFVIERLGELVLSEAEFLSGVKHQVEKAQIKLQCMSAFLKDADACVRHGDERVQLLVVKVRDTSYDLEDVIETYVFKLASYESVGAIRRALIKPVRFIKTHQVGSKIEKISSSIDTWMSELQKFGVMKSMDKAAETCSSHVQVQRELRRAYSHFVENDVVGFDKDIEELVAQLTVKQNPQNPRVISICGMGGLGKTTLARKVYQHPQVRNHFDCFAWASISQQCIVREVWEGILISLTSPTKEKREEIKSMSDGEIAKELYNIQKQRKCLVLLDDIWTTSTWDRLEAAFPQDETDSKILLTTRVKNVAWHADHNGFIHEPRCLNDDESWKLFQNKSSCFGKDPTSSKDNERMEVLGREMLKHCSGLPLAIIVLGGLLSAKQTLNEWEEMKRNALRYITKGKEHGNSEYNGVSWVLGLSYDELPFYLKPCFLYLACYPEDATIQVKELCLMLIAEGFILPRRSSKETIEDVAYDYLNELVERSMVQVENWGLTGRMKTFRIHDLMRDLCVSRSQDENFLHFIDLRNRVEKPLKSVSTVVRRVAIYFDDDHVDDFFYFVNDINGSLRCLIVETGRLHAKKQVLRHVFNSFFLLRVLNVSFSMCTIKLPKEIGKLIQLRLFSISGGANLIKIPSSIGNLRCLQTLKLSCGIAERSVPDVIWKLEQLRHLYFFIGGVAYVKRMRTLRLPNIRNLQTLAGVSTECLDFDDFLQLRNFKKLIIYADKNLGRIYHDPPTVTFDCLRHLKVLSHEDDGIDIVPMILSYPQIYKLGLYLSIVKLPEVSQFSPNLIKLTLYNTTLKDDPMPTLEKLSSLRVLSIWRNSFKGSEMMCSKGGFIGLESLEIDSLYGLEEWKVEEGAFSSLHFLEINGCRRLRRVPDGLRYIATLKEMKIKRMPKEFKERMEEGGEDFDKVHHVPSRVFLNHDE